MLASLDYFDWQSDDGLEFSSWWSDMIANDVVITSGWTEAYETHYTGGYGEWTEGYIGDAHITVSYCHPREWSRTTTEIGQGQPHWTFQRRHSSKSNMLRL